MDECYAIFEMMALDIDFVNTIKGAQKLHKIRKATVKQTYLQHYDGVDYTLDVKFFDGKTRFVLKAKKDHED